MVEVAAAAVGEKGDHLRPLVIRQQPGKHAREVGGDGFAAGGIRVHGEIDIGRDRFRWRPHKVEETDIRVDGTSRLDDVGVKLARVPTDRLVAHQKAAVEAKTIFLCHGPFHTSRAKPLIGFGHALGDQVRQCFRVASPQVAAAAVEVVARRLPRDHRPRVGVRGADHDMAAGNAGLLLDQLAGLGDGPAGERDQIANHQGHPRATLLQD